MIPGSRWVAGGALVLATAVHGAVLAFQPAPPKVEIEGGAAGSLAALGNSFADLAAGTAQPEPVTEVTPADTPAPAEATVPVAATPVAAAEPVTEAAPAEAPPIEFAALAPVPEAPAVVPLAAEAAAAEPPAEPVPAEAQPAETPATAEAVDETPTEAAPERTERPPERPERLAQPTSAPTPKEPAQPPKQTAARKAPKAEAEPPRRQVAAPAGNAPTDARKGSATGSAAGREAVEATASKPSSQRGNAAASNYPGQVFARINRARRSKVDEKGSALVVFSIGGNGALTSVAITQSSGSDRLDKAALAQVSRAAPFPPPPAGARRSFTVKITGR